MVIKIIKTWVSSLYHHKSKISLKKCLKIIIFFSNFMAELHCWWREKVLTVQSRDFTSFRISGDWSKGNWDGPKLSIYLPCTQPICLSIYIRHQYILPFLYTVSTAISYFLHIFCSLGRSQVYLPAWEVDLVSAEVKVLVREHAHHLLKQLLQRWRLQKQIL